MKLWRCWMKWKVETRKRWDEKEKQSETGEEKYFTEWGKPRRGQKKEAVFPEKPKGRLFLYRLHVILCNEGEPGMEVRAWIECWVGCFCVRLLRGLPHNSPLCLPVQPATVHTASQTSWSKRTNWSTAGWGSGRLGPRLDVYLSVTLMSLRIYVSRNIALTLWQNVIILHYADKSFGKPTSRPHTHTFTLTHMHAHACAFTHHMNNIQTCRHGHPLPTKAPAHPPLWQEPHHLTSRRVIVATVQWFSRSLLLLASVRSVPGSTATVLLSY